MFNAGDNATNDEKELLNGQYEAVLTNDFCLSTIAPLVNESFEEKVSANIDAHKVNHEKWFCTAVASLLYFIQNNWTGPPKKEEIDGLVALRKTAAANLSLNDQCNENVTKPELLYLAKSILGNDQVQASFPTSAWWLFRANYIHQLILDESSANLFDQSENLIKRMSESAVMNDAALKTLFCTEATYLYLYYTRMQSSEKYLEEARTTAKLSLELEGALGKRTKYQQHEKAQLYLKAKVDKDLFPYRACETSPKVINLSDDLRLEKIEFSEDREEVKLGSIEETIVMAEL